MTPPASAPYRYEARAWRAGLTRVAGLDESGRGPLAGPVVAAAVVLDPGRRIRGICDSKLLPPDRRHELFVEIQAQALGIGIGIVDHETIDRVNILQATRLAMTRALAALVPSPELVITDFVVLPGLACPQRNLVDGDARCATVAAASIVAKVTRDRLMAAEAECYPGYDFESNRGYRSYRHRCALLGYGPTAIHRRSWIYMENLPWTRPGPELTLFP